MIIYLSASENELATTDNTVITRLVTELLTVHMRGYHYIVIENITIGWLLRNINLQEPYYSCLVNIRQSLSQREAFKNSAATYINIKLGNIPLTKNIINSIYTIGHIQFLQGDYQSKPVLLVENAINDGDIYENIFHKLKKKCYISNICLEVQNGGGSAIVQAFERCIRQNIILVTITDSDKKHPNDNLSSEFRRINGIENHGVYIGRAAALPCRDIENLILISAISEYGLCPEYLQKNAHHYEHLNGLVISEGPQTHQCPLLYFDMKNGISIEKIAELPLGSQERNWINSTFSLNGENVVVNSIPGFGVNLISSIIRDSKLLVAYLESIDTAEWSNKFLAFFQELIWYFVSEKRRAIT